MPHISLQTVSPPAAECVDLDEMKSHLRVDGTDNDALIRGLIGAARDVCETWTGGRVAIATTFRLSLDYFPLMTYGQTVPGYPGVQEPVFRQDWRVSPAEWAIRLPRSPLLSVTSVKYYDAAGTLQTMDPAGYAVDADSEPPRISPSSGAYWPSAQFRPGAVLITFVAGYGTPVTFNGATVTGRGRSFSNDTVVRLANSGGTLPTELVDGTDYYVVGASGNTFGLSATQGGSAITTTSGGIGSHFASVYPPGAVAESYRAAMKLLVEHLYENRGDVSAELPMAVKALLGACAVGDYL